MQDIWFVTPVQGSLAPKGRHDPQIENHCLRVLAEAFLDVRTQLRVLPSVHLEVHDGGSCFCVLAQLML